MHELPGDVERAGLPVTRSFEVDEMNQRSRRNRQPVEDLVDRSVDRHRTEIAARQSDHPAAENVERGQDESCCLLPVAGEHTHRIVSTNFRKTFKPAVDDFSGWNWTPKTFPL